ncbi:hypothetical protein KKC83_05610 [Patescibacteria group bacterium]|nr:hypothetical protein [Candidatus Falkowbacteria bacterium]MBU3905878.1 hypothetical protein [Patescibacteria group bacterium]MBU4015763.1 hypothetical protein [Patescibacteria group bacterium]MBU4026992.1 hypothetical protein [Patescibacteria group bacterium]MBU4072777.1 hypothetical protein [Patescibacteria group bacterium]
MNTQLKTKLNRLVGAKVLDIEELKKLVIKISDPWEEVRGILKNKKVDAVKYQRKIRKELDRKLNYC